MIYDSLDNLEYYAGLNERINKGLLFLKNTDFSLIENGRHEIDGNDVFANISEYETQFDNPVSEAHKEYIDIQYVIRGEEKIGVGRLDKMECIANPEKETSNYHGELSYLPIYGNLFVILFPQDAHAAAMCLDNKECIRKAVVKVKI